MTKDLTLGSPKKLILQFSIPLFIGNIFQQLYNMADTAIVSKTMGESALGAVGATGSITFMILGFCFGIGGGFAIPVSHSFGAKDYAALRRYFGNIIWLYLAVSLVMTTATVLLCRPILTRMNTPPDIMDMAYDYLVVIFAGIPALFAYNTLSGIMRSLGDSKTPVLFLVFSSLLNVGLDLFFILVLQWGVAGAALATVLSQAVSAVGCLIVMIKRFDVLRLSKSDLRISSRHIKRLLAMGLPMGLQFSITAIGNIAVQTAVNGLGSTYVASVTAASRLTMLFTSATDSMGSTMATYCGQNIGAGRLDRIKQGVKVCMGYGLIYAAAAFLICLIFGRKLSLLFIDSASTQVLEICYQYLIINAAFFWAVSFVNIVRLSIQGLGYGKLAIFAGLLEMVGRSSAGFILVPIFGFTAACFAAPLAWVLADLFLIPAFLHIMKKLSSTTPQGDAVLQE